MSIVVSGLTYTYSTRTAPALRDITLTFQPGHLALIAGASGCGKTTLARCMNGLIPHSYTQGRLSGSVHLFGHDTARMPLSRISQLVGTVLQDPERQIVASGVMSEIAFGLENLGLPRQEILTRIDETARRLGISGLLERDTHRLSGGEKQKVALAGVLAMRPQALLLDEPLASLDPESVHDALTLMRQLADSGIAVVVIEHRVEDVLSAHPEHCVYMRDGAVVYDGDAPGLMQAVDWREIKLPAPVIIQRVRAENRATSQVGGRRSDVGRRPPAASSLSPPIVELEQVQFRYGDGPDILHGVSAVIRPGDVIALLGPNGAGKTTLAKHIIGLNRPTAGRVRVAGRDSQAMTVAQLARTIGYVFQSPSHMLFAPTVREELSFGPRNLGLAPAAIERNIAQALAAVNLGEVIDSPPMALSFGQQKRVSLAAILTMEPRVLVMDEPTAGQDYASYTRFMDDILQRRAGLHLEAVLYITHDLDLAITYANRIWLLESGRLIADDTPEAVLTQPALLERCRIRPTSLLLANLASLPRLGRFATASELAMLGEQA